MDSGGLIVASAAGRPSACMGGGGLIVTSAAARRSASMRGCGTGVATAAGPSACASMGESGTGVVTAAILCVKSRAVLGKISHSPERGACCNICEERAATTRAR